MAIREKILVGLMISALLYGGYTLVDFERKTPPTTDVQDTQVAAMALTALETATESRLTNLEWYILETALDTRGRNPFQRLEAMVREASRQDQPQDATRPTFVYEGFLQTEGTRLALINGRAYAEGEHLKEHGYVLLRIMERSVVLAQNSPSGVETWRQEFFLEDGFL